MDVGFITFYFGFHAVQKMYWFHYDQSCVISIRENVDITIIPMPVMIYSLLFINGFENLTSRDSGAKISFWENYSNVSYCYVIFGSFNVSIASKTRESNILTGRNYKKKKILQTRKQSPYKIRGRSTYYCRTVKCVSCLFRGGKWKRTRINCGRFKYIIQVRRKWS